MRAVLFFLYFSSYPSNPIHPIKTYFQAPHTHHRHLHLEKKQSYQKMKIYSVLQIDSPQKFFSVYFFSPCRMLWCSEAHKETD